MSETPNTATASSGVSRKLLAAFVVLAIGLAALIGVAIGYSAAGPSKPSAKPGASATPGASEATPATDAQPVQTHTDPKILELIRAQVKRDPADKRARGKVDAPVVLVEYSDFSCPMCARYSTQIEPKLEDLIENGTLRIEFRNLVVFHKYGDELAAAASFAAADQGKFWEFKKAAFESAGTGHPNYTQETLTELAKKVGIPDIAKFQATMNAPETMQKVNTETLDATQRMGMNGTPTFIINDAAFAGAQPAEIFRATILDQAKRAKEKSGK